jgi:hypothetical protein
MNGKLGWVWALAAGACLVAGCPGPNAGAPNGSGNGALVDSTELAAQARPPIPDVPMPVDFRYVEDRSYSWAAPGARTIVHVYHGPKDKFAVARFFRKQMPLAGWGLVNESDGWSVKTMDFTKANEICRITLQDGGLFVKTEVRVQVGPGPRAGESGTSRKQ